MINKQNFPGWMLKLLSVIAMVVSLGFLWSLDGDTDILLDKIRFTLQIGIPSGLVLIALIWAGASVDRKLANIPEKRRRNGLTLLAYLFIPLACGALVGLLALLNAAGFGYTWGEDASFGIALLLTLALIPLAFGTVFIYLGAIVSAASRWLAGRLWPEAEQDSPA